jgi:deoxyribonucleoside regulator
MASYSDEQLIMAARAYYIDQLPQAEVAKLLSVSQAKVSRMLTLARNRGLVQITVASANPRETALEDQIREQLGIESIVIRPLIGRRILDLRPFVGYFAAESLRNWLVGTRTIAIAGGRTIQAVIERLVKHPPLDHPDVVQAMGTVDASPGPFDAVELGLMLAHHWGSNFIRLNMPAVLQDAQTCQQLFQLSQVQHVMGRLAEADAALIGIGTLTNSVFAERGVISPLDQLELQQVGAVGEILGRFYNREGEECDTSYRDRVVSLPLEQLRKIPLRIGITTGNDRAAAIRAAIRGGLMNRLVIDGYGAKALLDLKS